MSKIGRPAGPAADTITTVLTAALELLLTEGGSALTPLRLHQATGVSRSTIYRHWATPTDVLAALIDVAPGVHPEPSGDVITDLHLEVDRLCDRLRDRPVAAFLQALVSGAANDEAGATLRRRYLRGILDPFHAILRTTDLTDTRIDDAVAVIVSPLLVDALLLDRQADRGRAHRAVDLFFARTPQ